MRIPFSSAAATVSNVTEAAGIAAQEGFHAVFTGDHINCALDRHLYHRMGRGVLGEVGTTEEPNFFESLTTLSFLAGKFPNLEFGIGVMLLPIREPILLAKQIANLDAFSHGRINVGIGIGNATDREEFGVFGLKYGFAERWALAREYLEAMMEIWTKPKSSYQGKYVRFEGATIYPKPFRKPHPPLWIGGHSDTSLRIGAQLCDGWTGTATTLEEFSKYKETFLHYAKEAGRGSDSFDFVSLTRVSISKDREDARRNIDGVTLGHKATSHFGYSRSQVTDDEEAVRRLNLRAAVGTPSDVLKRLEELVEAGITYFDLYFMYPELGHLLRQAKLFAKEIIPSFS